MSRRARAHTTAKLAASTATVLLFALIGTAAAGKSSGAQASHILRSTSASAGLCVVLGDDNAGISESLHNAGRMLVQKLTMTSQAAVSTRNHLLSIGLYGLVSAEYHEDWTTLPYADGLVNLLVIEKWPALMQKGLKPEEVCRVVAPGGAVYFVDTRVSGWGADGGIGYGPEGLSKISANVARREISPDMDGWTHYDHDPENTACSNDKTVKPSRFVKWTSGTGDPPNRDMCNPAFRIENGRAFYLNYNGKTTVFARDAFNGTLLWKRDIVNLTTWFMRQMMVAHGNRLYIVPQILKGPVEAWDAATGQTVLQYTKANWADTLKGYEGVGEPELLYCNDKLIQVVRRHIHVLNPATGDIIWEFHSPDNTFLKFACASSRENLLFVTLSKERFTGSRWCFTKSIDEIVCFDLTTGKERWRNTGLSGKTVGQLSYLNGYLAVMGSNAIIGGGNEAARAAIRVSNNKLLWSWDLTKDSHRDLRTAYSMFVRNDTMYYSTNNSIVGADLTTGGSRILAYKGSDQSGNNQRCARGFATVNYVQYGFGTWLGPNNTCAYTPVRRSSCATRGTPAYGMVYFTPAGCGCLPNVDGGAGFVALSADSGRVINHASVKGIVDFLPANWVAGSSVPTHVLRKGADVPATADGPIVSDWPESRPLALGKRKQSLYQIEGYTFEILSSRLHVHIYQGDRLISTVVTGGRIELAPVVYEGKAYIASRDGSVYCVALNTGVPAWRFFAAPYDRRIMSASQLESAWPVTRLALDKGLLFVDAGSHPGLVGGVRHYTLEPITGSIILAEVESVLGETLAPGQPRLPQDRNGFDNSPHSIVSGAASKADSRTVLRDLSGRTVPSTGAAEKSLHTHPRVSSKVYIAETKDGKGSSVKRKLVTEP